MGAALAFQFRDDPADGLAYRPQAAASLTSRPVALQRDSGQFDIGNSVSVLHEQHHGATMPGKSAPSYRESAERDRLRARVSRALAARMYPSGPYHVKQLAYAIGASVDTIQRLVNRDQDALALILVNLTDFFRGVGDVGFLRDALGDPQIEPIRDPAALLRAALREIESREGRQ